MDKVVRAYEEMIQKSECTLLGDKVSQRNLETILGSKNTGKEIHPKEEEALVAVKGTVVKRHCSNALHVHR